MNQKQMVYILTWTHDDELKTCTVYKTWGAAMKRVKHLVGLGINAELLEITPATVAEE